MRVLGVHFVERLAYLDPIRLEECAELGMHLRTHLVAIEAQKMETIGSEQCELVRAVIPRSRRFEHILTLLFLVIFLAFILDVRFALLSSFLIFLVSSAMCSPAVSKLTIVSNRRQALTPATIKTFGHGYACCILERITQW
uniref:Uncharacterized protein n=1 Tax=uncultured organism MedDCM-OCT-S12-C54 TaxID=743665 RepID=D6PJF9_9ZZZZ|nr:hypothetical protein [uncultured organism MedDCM-OCT-S12-C54]